MFLILRDPNVRVLSEALLGADRQEPLVGVSISVCVSLAVHIVRDLNERGMAVGCHGELTGDMAFHFRSALWLCYVRIFLRESQSRIIPHDGCSYMAAKMDRNWIE